MKKYLVFILMSCLFTSAYADAPMIINVVGDVKDGTINITKRNWGYQFNLAVPQSRMILKLISEQSVSFVCRHGSSGDSVVTEPGKEVSCDTDDAVLVSYLDERSLPTYAHYSIELQPGK